MLERNQNASGARLPMKLGLYGVYTGVYMLILSVVPSWDGCVILLLCYKVVRCHSLPFGRLEPTG